MKGVFVLGNGYSINLLRLLKEKKIISSEIADRIDLINLFSKGDMVPCPDGSIGYLSKKYCPNLWDMGIRSTISSEKASEVINNIIMSHRIAIKLQQTHRISLSNDKNIATYYELIDYIKRLFIYYNSEITDDFLKVALDHIDIPVIDDLAKDPSEYAIITYNYDIFLERLLKLKGIDYTIFDFLKKSQGVTIYKPHGSISFDVKGNNSISNIYDLTCNNIELNENLTYDYSKSLIIPPHGFIDGNTSSWVKQMRDDAKKTMASLPEKVVFWGIAYNYVDREEFNDIITEIQSQTDIEYVNPSPSIALDYIFSSIFSNYIHRK